MFAVSTCCVCGFNTLCLEFQHVAAELGKREGKWSGLVTHSGSHAGFYHVDYVISHLLASVDEVHVDGADGISVVVVVDVDDILRFQLVAIVVDFVLEIIATVHVEVFLASVHQLVHLGQGLVSEVHHLMEVCVLLLCEVLFLALNLQVYGASHVVA